MTDVSVEPRVAPPGGTGTTGSLLRGLGGALGTVAGLHLQYAQREAADDAGRVLSGVGLAAVGALLFAVALGLAHVALVLYLAAATPLAPWGAVLVVAAGDLGLAVVLLLIARLRLR
ncbi:MAG: phage holin family protein, partial [Myxococcota bacterium]